MGITAFTIDRIYVWCMHIFTCMTVSLHTLDSKKKSKHELGSLKDEITVLKSSNSSSGHKRQRGGEGVWKRETEAARYTKCRWKGKRWPRLASSFKLTFPPLTPTPTFFLSSLIKQLSQLQPQQWFYSCKQSPRSSLHKTTVLIEARLSDLTWPVFVSAHLSWSALRVPCCTFFFFLISSLSALRPKNEI